MFKKRPHFLTALILFAVISSNLSANPKTIEIVKVIEGEVVYFKISEDLRPAHEKGIFRTAKFLKKVDEITAQVLVHQETKLCYITEEFRAQIEEKLYPGIYVLLIPNIRENLKAEYDIIAVGTILKEGNEIIGGIETPSEPIIETSIPEISAPEVIEVTMANDESVKKEGEGTATPPTEEKYVGGDDNKPNIDVPTPKTETKTETKTIYVDPDNGNDDNTGSESDKLKTITKALENAEEGATIILAPSTYGAFKGESLPLNLKNGITLKSDTQCTMDGSFGLDGIIMCTNVTGVTIENIIFQHGQGQNTGGAISTDSSSVTIKGCTIGNPTNPSFGNTAQKGGGILATNSDVTIENCAISNNSVSGRGGGLWSGASNVTIINSMISNNTSGEFGGGIDLAGTGGGITITNCTFSNNTAGSSGGGIAIMYIGGTANISGNTIFNNNRATTPDGGGAIYMTLNIGATTIDSCTFKNSTGCGITKEALTTNPTITSCGFFNNNRTGGVGGTDHYYDFTGYRNVGWINLNLSNGTFSNTQLLADPSITGRIYDSVTEENISGPVVAIYDASTNTQIDVTTNNPYTFNVEPGKYYIAVDKSGYGFPSQIKEGVTDGDHGDIFTAANDPLTIDIPIDSDGWISVEKTCNKKQAQIGDIVTYRIKIQNKHWFKSIENVELVDEITNGLKYVDNSSINYKPSTINHKLLFNLGTVNANSTTNIRYQARVGMGIPPGSYKTKAYTKKTTTGERNSNESSVEIEIIEDPLISRGTIIGKVFFDENGNKIQDRNEPSIPDVKIYTEYGVVVETDKDGKYHIANVPAGNHLLKIDTTGLPKGLKFTTENPYYVKITEGLLAKVNFGVTLVPHEKFDESQITSHESQFFIVALGEGIVRNLDTSGNIEMVDKDTRFDDGFTIDGRLALYLKGRVLGKYLITASLDTERKPDGRYDTRDLFTNLDPDKYYPVYGDASKVDYSGVDTQDVVYVLVEWGESFAKWGSFHTNFPLYNRTLSGGCINYQSVNKTKFGDPYTIVKGFDAFSRQKPAHDEFVGTGGSLYYLRHREVIEGSEKLWVEIRDRLTKTVIYTIPLSEEIDYEIDYDAGRILLKKPLNSIQQAYPNSIISSDILMGERAYLVIDYEYYDEGMSNQAWGIRASQQIGPYVRVGGTYVEEQRPDDNYMLSSGDATLKLNMDTQVNARYTHTQETQLDSGISYTGGLTFTEQGENYSFGKGGNEFNINGQTRLFNNTDIYLSYNRCDPYYSVTNSISSQGAQRYVAKAVSRLTKNLSAGINHITQRYFENTIAGTTAGARDVHTTTGVLDYRINKWDLRGEYQHQEVTHPISEYTYFGTLPFVDNDFIAGRIGYQLFDWLHPYARGQGTIRGAPDNQGTIGTDIRVWNNTVLNIAETVGNLGDSTLVGLTSSITQGTDMYADLEVGNNLKLGKFTKTTYGQSTALGKGERAYVEEDYSSYRENITRSNVLGYNREITDTLAMGLAYERSNIEDNSQVINRDSGSIGLSYLNPDLLQGLKAYTKFEIRNDRGSNETRHYLTQNDLLFRVTEDITLSGRANMGLAKDLDTDAEEAEFYELGTGFSLRPLIWDWLNIIGKYSYITDLPMDTQWDFIDDIESRKHVYSIEGILDLCKYIQLVGKAMYRDMEEKVGSFDWAGSDTYLYLGRTNFHIFNNEENKPFLLRGWDLGVEYRTLTNDQIEDNKDGLLVELDKCVGDYLQVGVGYNFTDYDDDLRNEDNWDAKGWFVRFSGKY